MQRKKCKINQLAATIFFPFLLDGLGSLLLKRLGSIGLTRSNKLTTTLILIDYLKISPLQEYGTFHFICDFVSVRQLPG